MVKDVTGRSMYPTSGLKRRGVPPSVLGRHHPLRRHLLDNLHKGHEMPFNYKESTPLKGRIVDRFKAQLEACSQLEAKRDVIYSTGRRDIAQGNVNSYKGIQRLALYIEIYRYTRKYICT